MLLYKLGFVRRSRYEELVAQYDNIVQEYTSFVNDMKFELETSPQD